MNFTLVEKFILIESSYYQRHNYLKVHAAVANISEPLEYAIYDIAITTALVIKKENCFYVKKNIEGKKNYC